MDYSGQFRGHVFLVIIDAHSKKVYPLHVTTSAATVECWTNCFASEAFQKYIEQNGIQHITIAPWNPASNGLDWEGGSDAEDPFEETFYGVSGDQVILCTVQLPDHTAIHHK